MTRVVLTLGALLISTWAAASPVNNAQAAIKVGCASIHAHLPGTTGNCDDFVAVLRGGVWTVSQKKMPSEMIGGGAPVVEVSQETGEVLDFYLTD